MNIALIACTLYIAIQGIALGNNGFKLRQVPVGKSITLGRPATTIVPVTSKSRFTPTDLPQTLKVKIKSPPGVGSLELAIYDNNSDKVRYVKLQSNIPFLYPFKDLRTIMIKPKLSSPSKAKFFSMVVESDKPLEVGR